MRVTLEIPDSVTRSNFLPEVMRLLENGVRVRAKSTEARHLVEQLGLRGYAAWQERDEWIVQGPREQR